MKGELDGFAPKSGELSVGVGDIKPLDLALAVANVAEAVTVMADATVIDMTSAKIGVNVSPEEVENLPVNGRNFANLMTLATGRHDATATAAGRASGSTASRTSRTT